jgi:hypothetical protein
VDLVHSLSFTKTIKNSGKSQPFYTKVLALLAISDLVQILKRNQFSATILHSPLSSNKIPVISLSLYIEALHIFCIHKYSPRHFPKSQIGP